MTCEAWILKMLALVADIKPDQEGGKGGHFF